MSAIMGLEVFDTCHIASAVEMFVEVLSIPLVTKCVGKDIVVRSPSLRQKGK